MSLRLKLLLAALCTLALPWAGWQFVRLTEQLLREGQQQAWLTTAHLLAKAMQARGLQLPAGEVAYVQTAREPLLIDGYDDDWSALRPYAQAMGPATDANKLRVTLARRDGDLYLLAQVRDATRARFDPADPRSASGDHVTLVLGKDGRTARYRLIGAAPGSFVAVAQGAAPELPEQLQGALQDDGSGYRIELRIARPFAPTRLGIAVHDSAQPGSDTPELRQLVGDDAALAHNLQSLLPAHTRARVVLVDGWVLADAGELRADEFPSAQRAGGFAAWLYRHFFAASADAAQPLAGRRPRLDAGEVWQALSGIAATGWRPAEYAGAVVLWLRCRSMRGRARTLRCCWSRPTRRCRCSPTARWQAWSAQRWSHSRWPPQSCCCSAPCCRGACGACATPPSRRCARAVDSTRRCR